jgi:DNA-binding NarL/FixJ family response regulator
MSADLTHNTLRLVLASNRAGMRTLFDALGQSSFPRFDLVQVPVDPNSATDSRYEIGSACIVVVDVTPGPSAAVAFVQALRAAHPAMPVIGLLCCPEPVQAAHLSQLLRAGVQYLVDNLSPTDNFVQLLQRVATGIGGVHFALSEPHAAILRAALDRRGRRFAEMRMLESNRELLMLLTRGLSYDDIGRRLDMSTRTVRRRIDRLRAAIGAVNTVELAAWAGSYGLYRPTARSSARSG